MGPIIWNKTSIIKLILNNPIDQKAQLFHFSIMQVLDALLRFCKQLFFFQMEVTKETSSEANVEKIPSSKIAAASDLHT